MAVATNAVEGDMMMDGTYKDPVTVSSYTFTRISLPFFRNEMPND